MVSKLGSWFGVGGIPHAALINPSGEIVWRGHPGQLSNATIEANLAGALAKPLWEWPASAKAVRSALSKRSYGKAVAAAEKLDPEEGQEILATLRKMVTGQLAGLQALNDKGDYLGAAELSKKLEKELSGLPEGDQAKAIGKAIWGDKEAQAVIQGQKALAKLEPDLDELRKRGKYGKKKDADKLIAKLDKLIDKYPGTYVHQEAAAVVDELTKKRPMLR